MAELLALLTINIMPKYLPTDLAFGLTHEEFECKCDRKTCHYTLVAPSMTTAYERVRFKIDHELKINSGFRCQRHNDQVGGVETSSHTTGHAIDISFKNLNHNKRLELINLCRDNFDYIKIYTNFIHAQMRGE
jgi:hypothetical protein